MFTYNLESAERFSGYLCMLRTGHYFSFILEVAYEANRGR